MQMSNCDRCYRRKGKCDKLQPCGSCERAGQQCVYTDRSREKKFSSDFVERLEKRLRQAEARNRSLADELSRVQASANAQHEHPQAHDQYPAALRKADAVSEVSYLSINAAGERQPYLGSTSGVLLANLIRSSVEASVSRQSSPGPSGSEQQPAPRSVTTPTPGRKLEDLPPEALATKLLTAYVEHDHIAFPLILPSCLLDTLQRFYSDRNYYVDGATPYEAFIFSMVLAIATANVHKFDWQMLPSAESHHARAAMELNTVLDQGGLESLQAILLLCQYRQSSSIKDNSASMWHLVGIAARICIELGLHRESAYTIKYSNDMSQEQARDYRQQEIARRCFWSLVSMDRVTSNILGRPLAIRDEDIDTWVPSAEGDVIVARPLAGTTAGIPRILIFNQILRYRLFCGKIMITLHRKRAANMTVEAAVKVRDQLAEELENWYARVDALKLPDETAPGSSEKSCFLSGDWFRVLYANAMLMIWRPCPLLSDLNHDRLSLQRIYDSSIQAINLYALLHKSRKINYSWITLQSVFMAGLSYIYAVSRHLRERRNPPGTEPCLLSADPATIDVVNITRACSNVQVAISERWNALRHCHEVFDRLSDAVLADAIKLQTTPTPSTNSQPSPAPAPSPVTSIAHVVNDMEPPPPPTSHYQPHLTVGNQENAMYWHSHVPQHQQQHMHYPGPVNAPPLAVDNEFLHCYNSLQSMYNQQQVEDPIMHISQDWLGYLGGMEGVYDQNGQLHVSHMYSG